MRSKASNEHTKFPSPAFGDLRAPMSTPGTPKDRQRAARFMTEEDLQLVEVHPADGQLHSAVMSQHFGRLNMFMATAEQEGNRVARFETTFPPYVPFGSRLLRLQTPRQRGTDVAVLQAVYNLMLQVMNPPLGPMGSPITLDGIFGPQTRRAVLTIQDYFGLSVDGIAGSQTYFVFGQGVGPNTTYGGPVYGSRQLMQGDSGGDVRILQNRLNCFR